MSPESDLWAKKEDLAGLSQCLTLSVSLGWLGLIQTSLAHPKLSHWSLCWFTFRGYQCNVGTDSRQAGSCSHCHWDRVVTDHWGEYCFSVLFCLVTVWSRETIEVFHPLSHSVYICVTLALFFSPSVNPNFSYFPIHFFTAPPPFPSMSSPSLCRSLSFFTFPFSHPQLLGAILSLSSSLIVLFGLCATETLRTSSYSLRRLHPQHLLLLQGHADAFHRWSFLYAKFLH